MRVINKYLIPCLAALALVGCKDKMRELNTNKDLNSATDPRFMFLGATKSWDGFSREVLLQKYNIMQLMQYVVRYDYASVQYYNPAKANSAVYPTVFNQYWNAYYNGINDIDKPEYCGAYGSQLNTLIDYIDHSEFIPDAQRIWYADMRAVCQILNTYQAWRLFDVYGAAVYTEAFRAQATTDPVIQPTYDLIQNVYLELDKTVKEAIAVLAAEAVPNAVSLGEYDYFYGWKSNVAMGTPGATVVKRGDNAAQRKLWMKFANAFRLKMAWRFRARNPQHSDEVIKEVLALPDGLFASNDESCFYNYSEDHDNVVNDINGISLYFGITDNFMHQLKRTNDPRLPLLARTNGLDAELSKGYKYIEANHPTLLTTVTKNPNGKDQGMPDRLAPSIPIFDRIYQGQNANPMLKDQEMGPNMLLSAQSYSLTIAKGSSTGTDTTISLRVASPAQGRYFVKNGGSDGVNSSNDGDGDVFDWKIKQRRPIITYPEQCFTLAYLTAEGVSTGKTAEDWYNLGVKAAIDELRLDAQRYKIQIATSASFPKIAGLTDNGPYQITDDMIDDYLAANPYVDKESIVAQAWVYFYTHAEEMWGWWKLTGYPTVVPVQYGTVLPTKAYFVQPQTAEQDLLTWPRRCVLPGQVENTSNRLNAVDALIATEGYGSNENVTSGRIWWDKE